MGQLGPQICPSASQLEPSSMWPFFPTGSKWVQWRGGKRYMFVYLCEEPSKKDGSCRIFARRGPDLTPWKLFWLPSPREWVFWEFSHFNHTKKMGFLLGIFVLAPSWTLGGRICGVEWPWVGLGGPQISAQNHQLGSRYLWIHSHHRVIWTLVLPCGESESLCNFVRNHPK